MPIIINRMTGEKSRGIPWLKLNISFLMGLRKGALIFVKNSKILYPENPGSHEPTHSIITEYCNNVRSKFKIDFI